MALQQQTAAQQALNMPELLEAILSYLEPPQILNIQRVNTTFKSTIFESPLLRSQLFLNKVAKAYPVPQGYLRASKNPFFTFSRRSTQVNHRWNMIKGVPKFSYQLQPLYSNDAELLVHFYSKAEAFAVLRKGELDASWQKMYLTLPALATTIRVIYPRIKRTAHREVYASRPSELRFIEAVVSCEINVRVQRATLGRMIRLAAKIVATDPQALSNATGARLEHKPEQIYKLGFWSKSGALNLANHMSAMEFGTEQDALDGLALDDPKLSADRQDFIYEGLVIMTGEMSTARSDFLEDGLTLHERWYVKYGQPSVHRNTSHQVQEEEFTFLYGFIVTVLVIITCVTIVGLITGMI